MLVIPTLVVEDKINRVRDEVSDDIFKRIILPFTIFAILMMIFISFCLNSISNQITKPIIELYQSIQKIINSHQDEKEQLKD